MYQVVCVKYTGIFDLYFGGTEEFTLQKWAFHSSEKAQSRAQGEKKKVRLKEQKIANLARARSTENHIYNGKSGWQAEALHEAF